MLRARASVAGTCGDPKRRGADLSPRAQPTTGFLRDRSGLFPVGRSASLRSAPRVDSASLVRRVPVSRFRAGHVDVDIRSREYWEDAIPRAAPRYARKARARRDDVRAVAVNAPVAGRPSGRLAASRGPRALSSGRAVGPRPPLSSRGSTAARAVALARSSRASSSRDARADDALGSSDASDISLTDPDELDLLVALLPLACASSGRTLAVGPPRSFSTSAAFHRALRGRRRARGRHRLRRRRPRARERRRHRRRQPCGRQRPTASASSAVAPGVVGLTCRVGRAIRGSAELFRDLLASGRPCYSSVDPAWEDDGDSRDFRVLSEVGEARCRVDRRAIGGGDVPHPGIGAARRMQVPRPDEQRAHRGGKNHAEVIVVDEMARNWRRRRRGPSRNAGFR